VERWSEEDDPDASYHVECLKCGCNGPQAETQLEGAGVERPQRIAARIRRVLTAGKLQDRRIQMVAGCPASNGTEVSRYNATLRSQK